MSDILKNMQSVEMRVGAISAANAAITCILSQLPNLPPEQRNTPEVIEYQACLKEANAALASGLFMAIQQSTPRPTTDHEWPDTFETKEVA